MKGESMFVFDVVSYPGCPYDERSGRLFLSRKAAEAYIAREAKRLGYTDTEIAKYLGIRKRRVYKRGY
jgi:hypothetical protein